MKSLTPPFKPARRFLIAGVSLIEVVLALGILAFAIIPLIVLLAIGSTGYRSAMDLTVQAEIVQNIRTAAGQLTTNSTSLSNSYYKDDGTPTDVSNAMALYKAVNTIKDAELVGTNSVGTNLYGVKTDLYSIIHIPSGRIYASGAIHIFPRPQ